MTLDPARIKEINANLFMSLHYFHMNYEPLVMASVEEFTTDGTNFEYRLIRDNLDRGGWHDYNENADGEESSEYSEGSEDTEDNAGPEYAQASTKYYNNLVDTIIVKGSYIAYTSAPGYIKLETIGNFTMVNYATVENEEITSIAPRDMEIGPITIGDAPAKFDRTNLYLKARIMLLTDGDLAGMNKDELGYFRNEIFARHGHVFKTPKMIKYFENQDWYRSNIDDAVGLLNSFEKQNVEFIKSKEGK